LAGLCGIGCGGGSAATLKIWLELPEKGVPAEKSGRRASRDQCYDFRSSFEFEKAGDFC
jgi:hypothetical protein